MTHTPELPKSAPESVAIIGAGMAGLTCATSLMLNVPEVKVFERGLHAGGRMATCRAGGYEFDCGTQYFTVREEMFRESLESWLQERVVVPWKGWCVELDQGNFMSRNDIERYVAVPSMNALARHLTELCDVQFGREVRTLARNDSQLQLTDSFGEDLGSYDLVFVAVPPPAAVPLVTPLLPEMAERIAALGMTRCWVVMLGYEQPLPIPFDAAYVNNSPLSWVARNNSKSGRADREAWVLQATPEWSEAHAEAPEAEVIAELMKAFDQAAGGVRARPRSKSVKLWQGAAPIDALGEPFLFDAETGIGICGDWCVAPRVEGAFMSGLSLANHILAAT